jgi:hypothetical protein
MGQSTSINELREVYQVSEASAEGREGAPMVMMQSRLGCSAYFTRHYQTGLEKTSDVIGENVGGTSSQIENWEALWLGAIGVTGGSRAGDAEPVLLEAVLTLFFGCHVRSFHTR